MALALFLYKNKHFCVRSILKNIGEIIVFIGQNNTYRLCDEQRVEPQSEGDDEDCEDDDEAEEGLQDVEEHDDVDSEVGQLPDVPQEVQPGQDDHHRPELPLPALEARGRENTFLVGFQRWT